MNCRILIHEDASSDLQEHFQRIKLLPMWNWRRFMIDRAEVIGFWLKQVKNGKMR
jgi:hypothetical protein